MSEEMGLNEVIEAPETKETPESQETSVNDSVQVEDFKDIAPFLREHQTTQVEEPDDSEETVAESKEETVTEGEEESLSDTPEDEGTEAAEPEEEHKPLVLSDGREVTPEILQELEKGNMMHADYTKKTQKLAERDRELQEQLKELEKFNANKEQAEQALQLLQSLELDPIGTLNQLWESYEQQGITEPVDPEKIELQKQIKQLENEKTTIEKSFAKKQEQEAINAFNAYVDGLQEKYKDQGFNRDEVLQCCHKYGIPDPEVAFKAMKYDDSVPNLQKQIDELKEQIKIAGQEAVNEYVKKKAGKAEEFKPPVGRGGTGSPPINLNKKQTFKDARRAAMARLSNT